MGKAAGRAGALVYIDLGGQNGHPISHSGPQKRGASLVYHISINSIDMTHIQYQGETLPFPLVLTFHLVLGKFYIHTNADEFG